MKTIEQKAKRYDEALKTARKINSGEGVATPPDWTICEVIFPELKESEDDRIRKALIDWFSDTHAANDFRGIAWERIVAWIEKQGEQKSADKIEPKFKSGDWIVDNNIKTPFLITDISNKKYDVISIYGNDMAFSFHEVEHFYHIWTIQDAKDGDVLVASDKSLFIFDGSINENGSAGFHIAFTEDMGIILNSDDGCGWEEKGSCHPAIKEQRDLLFQKMKEAGYEWNVEKKELKKIEQKPIDVRTTGYWHVEDVEQKPAWSEEDKYYYGIIQYILNNECVGKTDKEEAINWFKSLKDRVQIKQEWKQENTDDLTDFENAMMHIGGSFFGENAGLDPNNTNAIKEQANLLLELVTKQEWSEEDKEILDDIILCGQRHCYLDARDVCWIKSLKERVLPKPAEWSEEYERKIGDIRDAITLDDELEESYKEELYDFLKSLRPQNKWKPSDEQMAALDSAQAELCSTEYNKPICDLIDALNKLKE